MQKSDKLRIRVTGEVKEAWEKMDGPMLSDIVTYIGPDETGYYDHFIEYSNGSGGTRCHDGSTFRKNKRDDDPDVIEIIS